MRKHITRIVCTAMLAVVANPAVAQPQRVEAPTEAPELPETPEVAAAVQAYEFATGLFGSAGATAGRALIIPKEAGDPKEFADAEEDLNVMARILEKAASGREEKNRQAMGIWVHGGHPGSAAPKNLYIEGYGALFFLNVNFPLLPPVTKAAEGEAKDKTSTEWEAARRELYRAPGAGFEYQLNNLPGFSVEMEQYDSEIVEDLKRNLISALKNAAHIRNLKSDDVVTVVVSGRGPGTEGRTVKKLAWEGDRSTGGAYPGRASRTATRGPDRLAGAVAIAKGPAGGTQGTRLILRARKADIDAFQKEKTSLEDFSKKVTTIVY